MSFEKTVEAAKYHELPDHTKYRFAELEIGKAITPLTTLHLFASTPRQAAQNLLLQALVPAQAVPRKEHAFHEFLNAHSTIQPPKADVIQYLLVQGHSYSKIRELTSASYNTISKYKFGVPQLFPHYPYWDMEMLQKWNHIKKAINVFQENLAHCNN